MGIETIENPGSFEIFPNPGTGIFNFRFENPTEQEASLEILSMNGQVILKQNFIVSSGMFESSFDLSGSVPGIYLVRIISGDKVVYDKVILQ